MLGEGAHKPLRLIGHFTAAKADTFDACLGKRTPDKPYIVGCSATSAGLGHDDCQLCCIVLTRQNGIHYLPDHDK